MSKPIESDATERHDDSPNDRISSLGDGELVTFRQIGEWLDEKPNTVSARYYPRVSQAHEGLETPALQVDGRPTGYAAKAIALYLQMGKDFSAYQEVLQARFPRVEQAQAVEVAIAPYQPNETSLLLDGSLEWHEDTRLQAIARAAMTIQEYNAQVARMQETEDREVFEQAFTEEVERLEAEARRKMVAHQAKLKARQFFQSMGDGAE